MKKQLKCYLLSKDNLTFLHIQPINSKTDAVLACNEAYELGYRITKAYYCHGAISFDLRLPNYFRQITPPLEPLNKISLLEEWIKAGLPRADYYKLLQRIGMLNTPIGL